MIVGAARLRYTRYRMFGQCPVQAVLFVRSFMHLPYIEVANVSLEQKQPMFEMSHPASLDADVAHES